MRTGLLSSVVLAAMALSVGCKSDSDGTEGGGNAERGEGVPETWGKYCTEIAESYCQREADCAGDDIEQCTLGFMVGCCEAENSCGSSFGEGASTEDYDACIDDTNDAACGSRAPESCQDLAQLTPSESSEGPRSLLSACAGSCLAQEATNCPGGFPASRCIDGCLQLVETFPDCEDAWIALNTCMIDAPLTCDMVNGGAAVSSRDCGPEIEAFASCT